MKQIITLFAALSLLSGCAGGLKVSDDYTFGAKGNEGIIVASTRTDDKCRGFSNSSSIGFQGDASTGNKAAGFFLENSFMKNDFNNPPGYFQMIKLPAGTYTFNRLYKTGVMEGSLPLDQFKISFTVKPGKVHYLGEIHGDIPDCNTVVMTVKDQRKRDGMLFDKKMKRLKSSDFDYQILKVAR